MESNERDLLERRIECELEEERLRGQAAWWRHLRDEGVIDSVESAVIGSVFGSASLYFNLVYFGREVSDEAWDDFREVFKGAVEEIKERLSKTAP